MVQDWITLELAIRIRYSKGESDISEAAIEKLRFARRLLFAIITVAFVAFSATVIVTAHKSGNDGLALHANGN